MIKIFIGLVIIITIMWVFGKAFESDLKDLEETNPKYRKFLKDKYDI
jgi:hypothetical protein